MPVPLPVPAEALRVPPDETESRLLSRGIASAIAPAEGLTSLQSVLIEAISTSMTGYHADLAQPAIDARSFA